MVNMVNIVTVSISGQRQKLSLFLNQLYDTKAQLCRSQHVQKGFGNHSPFNFLWSSSRLYHISIIMFWWLHFWELIACPSLYSQWF